MEKQGPTGSELPSILECQTHEALLEIVYRFYRPQGWDKNAVNLYLHAIGRIPLEFVGTSVLEWIDNNPWMPKANEWRRLAVLHWEEANRQKRLSNPRLEMKPGTPLTSQGLRAELRRRADAGCQYAAGTLAYIEKMDRKRAQEVQ